MQLCGNNGVTDAKFTCEGQRSYFFTRTLGIMPKEFGRVNHCFEHMSWSLEDSSSGL